ncbi:MAG: group II intron reverse transcriptase/maturase [Planctomycetota bacterium]|jgi:group II intron reverse transcriptase/maturase
MAGTPSPEKQTVSTKLLRIAQLAKQSPQMSFTSLSHHIDLEWLKEAYRSTRKSGAPGIDGQTAREYAENLEENLQSLLNRAKSGSYRAPAVRRVHIPKGRGKETRPLGIPTFEDKVLQRAVLMALEAVYEQDFKDCSYGFRPGRRPHQALQAIWKHTMKMTGCWVLEVDLRKYFDTVDRDHLREILRQRVRDGVLLRLIGKWLKAGVLEEGRLWYPEKGTPQGGVISPLLANIYLHEVLDVWFEREVKARLKGRAFLIRYADDFILGFEHEEDARKVMAVLPNRFGKYGLTIHPTKTRLVDFRPPTCDDRSDHRGDGGGSFSFLGFTHFWGWSRKGERVVARKTAKDRLTRAMLALAQWCRANRHWKIREQHKALGRKLMGHDQYYGITGNWSALWRLRRALERVWRKWLGRRSQNGSVAWDRFHQILERYPLPKPRILHSRV